jgi:uridine phosphorylase
MSCDAMYSLHHRQTMVKLSDKGIIGSEMEGSMIFTLSSLKGIKAGMIFHANLNIKNNETSKDILNQNKIREEGEKKTIIIALNAIKKLSMEVKK